MLKEVLELFMAIKLRSLKDEVGKFLHQGVGFRAAWHRKKQTTVIKQLFCKIIIKFLLFDFLTVYPLKCLILYVEFAQNYLHSMAVIYFALKQLKSA